MNREYYLGDDVVYMAKDLLGRTIVTNINNQITKGLIVETEAYRGYNDKACHANNGRRTSRNEIMYAPGGKSYVYLCYGIHHLFNVVTNTEGKADAVLVRAIQPLGGLHLMRERFAKKRKLFGNGPGVLTKALGISTQLTGEDLLGDRIWIEEGIVDKREFGIIESRRVGVDYAEEDADLPWRFYILGNENVSRK